MGRVPEQACPSARALVQPPAQVGPPVPSPAEEVDLISPRDSPHRWFPRPHLAVIPREEPQRPAPGGPQGPQATQIGAGFLRP